jgi:hypothetical protein
MTSEETNYYPHKDKNYEKSLKEICSYLTYAQKNIKYISDYRNSYIEKFFKDLENKIYFSKDLVNIDFKDHLKNCINIFNIFFKIDLEKQNQELKEKFNQQIKTFYIELEKCMKEYNFEKFFTEFRIDLENFFENVGEQAESILEKNDDDVEKAFISIAERYKVFMTNFINELNNKYQKFLESLEKIYKLLVVFLGYDEVETLKSDTPSKNIDTDRPIGTLVIKLGLFAGITAGLTAITVVFPLSVFITAPISIITGFFFGKSISKTLISIFSAKQRLLNALEEMKEEQLKSFDSGIQRFLRDINEKKENFKKNSDSLINIKRLELSSKSNDTKNFYKQLKKDYEELYNILKNKYNLDD